MQNTTKPLALIIDDEQSICDSLEGVLMDEGWDVCKTLNGKDGIAEFKSISPQLVFLDVWMKELGGVEVLQELKNIDSNVPVVIMSGHATIDTAVRVTKLGALDFLEKPLSLDKILPMLEHSIKLVNLYASGEFDASGLPPLIGNSESIQVIRKQINLVAHRNTSVIITGANGTGKEVVAVHLHKKSLRAKMPFIAVNCAAIPEELIESDLFGHIRGAFSGAVSEQKGKFELADSGTLFLDEIGDMSLRTQAKILRVLQDQTFVPVGSDKSIKVDVRIIAATNKDLQVEIKAGRFREDLYYRLNVVPFELSVLKDRVEDIELLVTYFLRVMALELNEMQKVFDEESINALKTYSWPGNVRELKNIIERLCVMSSGRVISLSDLPVHLRVHQDERSKNINQEPEFKGDLKKAKGEFERSYIVSKLQENDGNISKTAENIGLERSNLHKKLKAYKINPKNKV